MKITSKSNEKIKYIASLKEKKYRDKHGKYILEGIKLVDEYISSEETISPEFIVMCKEILLSNLGGDKLYNKIVNLKNIIEVDDVTFKSLTDTVTPQGVLIVLPKRQNDISNLLKQINRHEKMIILDKVQDAGNLGTIIRSAVSFNIKAIICIKGTVDVYSSKVIRSTMGAINKVDIYYVDENELLSLKEILNNNGYSLIATDLKAKKYLDEIVPKSTNIYVLGNEANGVSENVKSMCDDYIKIKMEEKQESLNVSIATSILLYDMYTRGE